MENSERDGNTRPPDLTLEKHYEKQVKKLQLEPDMEQLTGSKLGKEDNKAVYYHAAYLIYIQSILCKMPGWMNHKLESIFPGEISMASGMQKTPPLWQKVKRNSKAS